MEKIGAYKILNDRQFIIEYYSGIIGLDDLVQLKKAISKEPNYDFSMNTVLDIRDTDLRISQSESVKLLNFFSKKFKGFSNRKVAYLTHKPSHVALSYIFSHIADSKKLSMNTEIFSTIDGVVDWFSPGIKKETLETTIFELKTKPNNVYTK